MCLGLNKEVNKMDEKKGLVQLLNYSIVFYDVDTQVDFMLKDGALYVPGAEKIIPNIEKLTNHARQQGEIIMGSVDKHAKGDAELLANGGPFPEHCMDGEHGQKKIWVTNPVCPAYIENKMMRFSQLEHFIGDKREVFFEKQHYDVFTNPNAKSVLEHVCYAVVYGVATDYCVKAAVLGMRNLGIEVFLVKDAVKGITQEGENEALKEMKDAGAHFFTTKDVLSGKVLRYVRAFEGICQ